MVCVYRCRVTAVLSDGKRGPWSRWSWLRYCATVQRRAGEAGEPEAGEPTFQDFFGEEEMDSEAEDEAVRHCAPWKNSKGARRKGK